MAEDIKTKKLPAIETMTVKVDGKEVGRRNRRGILFFDGAAFPNGRHILNGACEGRPGAASGSSAPSGSKKSP